jgi:hypothetical protein
MLEAADARTFTFAWSSWSCRLPFRWERRAGVDLEGAFRRTSTPCSPRRCLRSALNAASAYDWRFTDPLPDPAITDAWAMAL